MGIGPRLTRTKVLEKTTRFFTASASNPASSMVASRSISTESRCTRGCATQTKSSIFSGAGERPLQQRKNAIKQEGPESVPFGTASVPNGTLYPVRGLSTRFAVPHSPLRLAVPGACQCLVRHHACAIAATIQCPWRDSRSSGRPPIARATSAAAYLRTCCSVIGGCGRSDDLLDRG